MDDDRPAELEQYSKFYVEYLPRLVAFLIYNGLSLADAADCAQEALIDALPPVWGTLEHPYAWCRRVAHRKSNRLRGARREVPVSDWDGRYGTPLITPGAELEQFERNHEFLHWLNRLDSEREREVLAWFYDGATTAEIAEELRIEAATVRSTLRNARAKLRRLREEAVSSDERR